jgi:hypothetical protein
MALMINPVCSLVKRAGFTAEPTSTSGTAAGLPATVSFPTPVAKATER